jgi:Ca2+-binding RTX toxin-like protein
MQGGGSDMDFGVLIGDNGSNTLIGNDDANHIMGLAGNDFLDGRGGDDLLEGDLDNDFLVGGPGNDTLIGGPHGDILVGGEGNDTYFIDHPDDTIVEEAGGGGDQVFSYVSYSLRDLPYVGNLQLNYGAPDAIWAEGNNSDNTLVGNELDNTLIGLDGNDFLDGGLGDDTMIGGKGDDTYVVNSPTDVIIEEADGGEDTIIASISFSLENQPYIGKLRLVGDAYFGQGNGSNNELVGSDRSNRLDGGDGDDLIRGTTGIGQGETDILVSGSSEDRDLFILSESGEVYYDNQGNGDFAWFQGFDIWDGEGDIADQIRLLGGPSNYSLGNTTVYSVDMDLRPIPLVSGAGIFHGGDLIAVLEGIDAGQVNLASPNFTYL